MANPSAECEGPIDASTPISTAIDEQSSDIMFPMTTGSMHVYVRTQ